MLEFVKGFPGVRISQAELDSDPLLLGVANGVLNLLTGQLVPNSPDLLITRYARAKFIPDAKAPMFMKYMQEVCMGRQELVDFVQEILGYSLSGLTKEQAFFLLLGAGANGKSTLVDTQFHLLGDYAKGLPAHTFIKSESRAIRNDLARLPGVRFAPCAEVNTGKSLDESMVKRSTGGDVMTARFIGKEFFDFHLSAKFFFSVNTLPRVVGADNGIYRRLVVLPFDGNFEKTMDTELPEKLKGEIDGILTWALKGFQRWHKRGHLIKPDCVVEACKAYRAEMDTVQSFLDDACHIDPKATTPLSTLYEAYQQWAKGTLVDPANKHLFGTLMGQKGFRKEKSGSWRWKGVALKSATSAAPNTLFAGLSQPAQAGPTQ
jgi:putative DNA primase/helicase